MEDKKQTNVINTELATDQDKGIVNLSLYPDDFSNPYDWEAICEHLDVSPHSSRLILKVIDTQSIIDTFEDEGAGMI